MPALIALLVKMLRVMLMAKPGAMLAKVLLFFGFTIVTDQFATDPVIDHVRLDRFQI